MVMAVAFCLPGAAMPLTFTPGDLLITREPGSAHTISEYTPAGTLVQTFDVPIQPTNSFHSLRDIAVDQAGRLQVFTTNPYDTSFVNLYTFNPSTQLWTTRTFADWTTPLVGAAGQLTAYSNYVFATDSATSNGEPNGVIRFNFTNGTAIRFAIREYNSEPIDVSLGLNNRLYLLEGEGSPSGRIITIYDPDTLTRLTTWTVPFGLTYGDPSPNRNLAADAAGNIYLVHGSTIHRFSAAFQEIGVIDLNEFAPTEIEFDRLTGRLWTFGWNGLASMNSDFSDVRFISGNFAESGYGAVVVPESPLTPWYLAIAGLLHGLCKSLIKRIS